MARVQYGALVTKIQGKVSGMVFQDNFFGNTLKMVGRVVYRVRHKPVSGSTDFQMTLAIARASQRWYNLTQAQQIAWNNYALAYPQYAKHAPSTSLAGYYIFMKRNVIAEYYDSFRLDDPSLIPTSNPTFAPTLTRGSNSLLLTFNETPFNNDIDSWIFMSNWAKGSNAIRKGQEKFIIGYAWPGGDVDVYSQFLAVYGSVPVAGNTIFVQIQNIGDTTGAVFARQTYKVLIGT